MLTRWSQSWVGCSFPTGGLAYAKRRSPGGVACQWRGNDAAVVDLRRGYEESQLIIGNADSSYYRITVKVLNETSDNFSDN